jgi:phosphoribosylamine---glycine ligase
VVTPDRDAARAHAAGLLEAGHPVLLESFLDGPEVSLFCVVDGRTVLPLLPAQDFKRVGEGDTGPNTGGMGAYAPLPWLPDDVYRKVVSGIVEPVAAELVRRGSPFCGLLYVGLAITANGPAVVEFNCRFGDPETQPLIMRLKSDLLQTLLAVAEGRLDQIELSWDDRPAICVVAASKGYPGQSSAPVPITGVEAADGEAGVKVFQAGTKLNGQTLMTDGGRVLSVTAIGADIADARRRAYGALAKIHFDGMHYRRDIAHQALR